MMCVSWFRGSDFGLCPFRTIKTKRKHCSWSRCRWPEGQELLRVINTELVKHEDTGGFREKRLYWRRGFNKFTWFLKEVRRTKPNSSQLNTKEAKTPSPSPNWAQNRKQEVQSSWTEPSSTHERKHTRTNELTEETGLKRKQLSSNYYEPTKYPRKQKVWKTPKY